MVTDAPPAVCALCGSRRHDLLAEFTAPPPGETDFGIADYRRRLWQCAGCGHIINRYGFDLTQDLYRGSYSEQTYGDRRRATFAFIVAAGRTPTTLLDIGSGLGVFPAAMAAAGWRCTALDPDPAACAMIEELAGVDTVCHDFMTLAPARRYDLVSFNKVLEHVPVSADMLAHARDFLTPIGILYLELPDGEAAIRDSAGREEFFVEHYCAFSMASLTLLIRQAGFQSLLVERVREPSSKYTLRAFLGLWPEKQP